MLQKTVLSNEALNKSLEIARNIGEILSTFEANSTDYLEYKSKIASNITITLKNLLTKVLVNETEKVIKFSTRDISAEVVFKVLALLLSS